MSDSPVRPWPGQLAPWLATVALTLGCRPGAYVIDVGRGTQTDADDPSSSSTVSSSSTTGPDATNDPTTDTSNNSSEGDTTTSDETGTDEWDEAIGDWDFSMSDLPSQPRCWDEIHLLLVIDRSPGMAEYQARIAARVRESIDNADLFWRNLVVRVGVATSDQKLHPDQSCELPGVLTKTAPQNKDDTQSVCDGLGERPYFDAAADDTPLDCLVLQGASSDADGAPIAATLAANEVSGPTMTCNGAFFADTAARITVIATNGDDVLTPGDPEAWASEAETWPIGWNSDVAIGLLAGPAQAGGDCLPILDADGKMIGGAEPAPRLSAFVDALPDDVQTQHFDICDGAFDGFSEWLFHRIEAACESDPPPEFGDRSQPD